MSKHGVSVILDVGSTYIKCGIGGELHPRYIIPDLSNEIKTVVDTSSLSISPIFSMNEELKKRSQVGNFTIYTFC